MLRVEHGDEMIEEITNHFDWVFNLPIESQCHFAIGLSFFGFVVAALVRETVKHTGLRYLARAIGAASFFAVAAFAHHVAHENEKLYSELMVRRHQKASEIASHALVTLVTPKGNVLEIGETSNGLRGTRYESGQRIGELRRKGGIYTEQARRLATGRMGGNGCHGAGDDGVVSASGMLEQSAAYCLEWLGVRQDARCFQLPRETEGKRF